MIEIKKPSGSGGNGLNFITVYKDLVADGVNFTTLHTNPYKIFDAQGLNNCITPINLIIDYTATGSTIWPFAISTFSAIPNGTGSAFFTFLGGGTNIDVNKIIVTGINSQSQNCGLNQYINEDVYLWNATVDEHNADFSRFKIYFTYYLTILL